MNNVIRDETTKRSTSTRFSGRKLIAFSALAFCVLFFMVLTILLTIPVKNACVATLKSGRQITVVSDSLFLDFQYDHDTAKIMTRGKLIVVKPNSILVDNHQTEYIAPDLMDVRIDCRNGEVRLEPRKNLSQRTSESG